MRLSIIIPAYNVEPYLERCIDSCMNQDIPHEKYEVIVVDDGSTDNTLAVAKRLAEKYSNMVVRTQENLGQSVARNLGIDIAQGEYLWFVDSDDYVKENVLKNLIETASLNNLDFLYFSLQVFWETGELRNPSTYPNMPLNKVVSGKFALMNNWSPGSACKLIVKRNFIKQNNLYFYVGIYHQDVEFTFNSMIFAQRVMFTDIVAYMYYKHQGTVTTSRAKHKIIKNCVDNGIIFLSIRNKLKCINDPELAKKVLQYSNSHLLSAIMLLWRNRKNWKPEGINAIVLNEYEQLGIYPIKGPYNNWKHRFIYMFILNHKWLFT